MTILSIAADVLWILSLSIMASATRTAWMRMEPDTRVPMQGSWRLSRNVALPLPIVLAFLFGMARNLPLAECATLASELAAQNCRFLGGRGGLAVLKDRPSAVGRG